MVNPCTHCPSAAITQILVLMVSTTENRRIPEWLGRDFKHFPCFPQIRCCRVAARWEGCRDRGMGRSAGTREDAQLCPPGDPSPPEHKSHRCAGNADSALPGQSQQSPRSLPNHPKLMTHEQAGKRQGPCALRGWKYSHSL